MRLLKLLAMGLMAAAMAMGQQPSTAEQGPKTTPPEAPKEVPGFDINALDKSANPCQDFFQYACGGWLKNNEIPPDKPAYGRFTELQERNRAVLHRILEKYANPQNQTNAVEQKIGDYYASCMDEATINEKGIDPLKPELDRIDKLQSKEQLPELVAQLQKTGVNALFSFGSDQDFKNSDQEIAEADQGGLGLPDRDYYFKDDPKSVEQRKQYVEHVTNMFKLMGEPEEKAAADAQTVMSMETELAKGALNRTQRRNPDAIYHKQTTQDLQALSPAFNWARYLVAVDVPEVKSLNVAVPDFFKGLQSELSTRSLDDIKTYLRWHVLHSSAPMLSKPFVDENFNFYGKVLAGTTELEPRWKRCVRYTDNELGEALGQKYVEEAFGPESKARTLKMISALETALKQDIENLSWMTPATKKQALVKLAAIANKIGYPDKWRDYSKFAVVRGQALLNAENGNTFEFNRQLAKIGKPVDKTEWLMTPPTVNAYYDPQMNNINFPAGILQPPFYDNNLDDAVNFGGIGAVIGHELTHGFDDQGAKFDPEGNLKDWWTPTDEAEFNKRTACIADEYSNFVSVKDPSNPKNDVNLNGRLTLGENTADNGGVRIAYMALENTLGNKPRKKIDGFTPEQRLFLGFGQVWCEKRRPEYNRMLSKVDPHSPGQFRVNGTVSNMPEFAKAYSCKKGDAMVRADACHVW